MRMLLVIYSHRSDRYTYIDMPFAILIYRCSFLLTLRSYCWVLKRILGSDKSLNSPLNKAMNFDVSLCVADRREESRAEESGVRVINHCVDGDLVRIVVSDGWPISLYALTNH